MSILASPRFLPRVMAADAISCAATGAVQLGLTDTLARLTGLPAVLLTGTGLFLLAYAALAAWMARRPVPPRRLIGLVVAGNLAWAVGGVALLASGLGAQTPLGVAWVLAQALVVIALAQLQWMGLRATRPAHGRMAAA
ncbi:hypothetical protein [Variovorax sp. N23]|uniref:hypothetical protein n=1 Tax=Variovorax sp. N23 TaxID=2980555 RepID=UPI0021C68892|nr:hypothetical protein [Variovorax sp. N23]MCU4117651.1 hypothetical protein [Variovorax sp. N23]